MNKFLYTITHRTTTAHNRCCSLKSNLFCLPVYLMFRDSEQRRNFASQSGGNQSQTPFSRSFAFSSFFSPSFSPEVRVCFMGVCMYISALYIALRQLAGN